MIFVFSGTGNSFAVAKRIKDATGLSLVDVAWKVRYEQYTYNAKGEDVGFVFPTYFLGLPRMVLEMARHLEVRNPGRVFAVATCGSVSGGACEQLAEALRGRLEFDAFYDVAMPDNAVFLMDPPSKEEAEAILAGADPEIDAIAQSVKEGRSGDFRTHRGAEGDFDWRRTYEKYDEYRVTEPFRATDRCILCKVCAEICPERAIVFYHRRPVWDEERCSLCCGCINMCPKHAIEYGEGTEGRNRYWHPMFYEKTLGIQMRYDEFP